MSTAVVAPAKVPNFVNGEWVESTASEWINVVNPATGDAIASVPLAASAEVAAAVEAGAAAFPAWRRTPPEDRIQPLFKLKTLMEEHEKGEVLTGVFYVDTEKPTFTDLLNLVDQPLSSLPESVIRPSKDVLDKVMASLQ